MICEKCKKKKAVFYRSGGGDGFATAHPLCEDCAAALKKSGELTDISSVINEWGSAYPLSESQFFGNFLRFPKRRGILPTAACPSCQMTLSALCEGGQLGCAECYGFFSEEIAGAIRQRHGFAQHAGSQPNKYRAKKERAAKISSLRDKLRDAVKAEDFELAVSLRDQIRNLECEL